MEGWKVAAAENGSVVGLERNGCIYADEAHPLGAFLYEVFSPEDYQRFEDQYVTVRYDWALEEFGKIGMEKAVDRHLSAEPKVTGVWKKDSRLLIQMSMPKEAVERFGAPARLELLMTFSPKSITFDLAWFQKSASRVAEGLWIRFCPPQILTGIHKMGEWFRPEDMVLKGGRRLHAVEDGVRFETCAIRPLDCAQVSAGGPSLLSFDEERIPVRDGVSFNLFNNVWNTNFPMWYDQDARFRFIFGLA